MVPMTLPHVVVGYTSPYPTVLMVATAHQQAPRIELILGFF